MITLSNCNEATTSRWRRISPCSPFPEAKGVSRFRTSRGNIVRIKSFVSLESGIGDRGIHVHHIAGLHMARQIGEVSLHARLPFLTS